MRGELSSLHDVLWRDAESAMVVLDGTRRIVEANPAARAILEGFGLADGDRLGGIADAVYSGDGRVLTDVERPVSLALDGQVVPPATILLELAGESELRRLVMSARPIALPDGAAGALVTWHDVTDSWQTQERNGSDLTRLGQLLEGAADHAIIMLDAYGRVMSWSAAARRMQGYTEADVVGISFATFFDEGERDAGVPEEVLTKAVATGRSVIEGKQLRKDGSVFWAHSVVTAMRDEDGQLRGFVRVTQDVSDKRATQRAVVQLNAELQQINGQLEQRVAERTGQLESQAADLAAVNSELEAFSYSVSHDLRAPLRAMSGYARILEEEYAAALPPEAVGYLAKVQENAVQMGSLIDALLSFSRLQRQNLNAGLLDMTTLVHSCWETLAPARAGRSVQLVVDRLPPAAGDARLMQQVWLNLLDNAIKYTGQRDDARVEVNATADGDVIAYAVADNGAGFDMRYVDKLGQVFHRLHRPEDFAGTGIGLALVQRIVTRHGGRLTAAGEPGKGATMGFTLPGRTERWT